MFLEARAAVVIQLHLPQIQKPIAVHLRAVHLLALQVQVAAVKAGATPQEEEIKMKNLYDKVDRVQGGLLVIVCPICKTSILNL